MVFISTAFLCLLSADCVCAFSLNFWSHYYNAVSALVITQVTMSSSGQVSLIHSAIL